MKHRTFALILFFVFVVLGYDYDTPASSGREVLDMNTDWAIYRGEVTDGSRTDLDDSGWIPVACLISCNWKRSIVEETPFMTGLGGIAAILSCLPDIKINGLSSLLKE